MHPNPRKIAPIILVIAALAALAYWFFVVRPTQSPQDSLAASGTIEVTQINLGPELAGRLVEVLVTEGQSVVSGDVLARLDASLLEEQRGQAWAAWDAAKFQAASAQANLELLKAGSSAEQLAVSAAALNQAQVAADAAQAVYADLPDALQDTADGKAALAKADAAAAALQTAQAQFDLVKAGARPEQIVAAENQAMALAAQVQAAEAALKVLDVQLAKLTLLAPADGVIFSASGHVGEFAAPGSTLFILGRVDEKTITVYIPEAIFGQISLGQFAEVRVDSFPGQVFQANVSHIAEQAEFTPRNVQTTEGRKNTVFAVRLQLSDPDNQLKAGMPADVVFQK